MNQDWTDLIIELIFLLPILLLSMMAHEVLHGFVAYRLGDPTAKAHGRLTLNPLKHLDPLGTAMFVITYVWGGVVFGWAKPIPVSPYYFRSRQRGMMLVAAAGPAANFGLAVVFAVILNLIAKVDLPERVFTTIFLAYQVNVVLGVFNLVPIPPLDGSRILGGLLPPRAYAVWTSLDRYGMIFIFAILFVLRGPFFSLLSGAYDLISRLLLPTYF